MQDFAMFCNAKNDFFQRERAVTRSQQLRTQVARLGVVIKRALQFHCNTAIDKSQLCAKLEA
jgi:hypothetical protein